ncbi:MAG: XRE family transcriptional regulator, partial [Runella slithyformis]
MQNEMVLQKFGARLKALRQAQKISQEQLSERAGIDRSYISDVERGLRNIALQNIDNLANALAVPVYFFFLEENSLLLRWEVNLEELETLIQQNPSLRGFLMGYLAEAKLNDFFRKDKRVSSLKKFNDHDRTNKSDLTIGYKGREYAIEIKSLQTSTVKKSSGKLFTNV